MNNILLLLGLSLFILWAYLITRSVWSTVKRIIRNNASEMVGAFIVGFIIGLIYFLQLYDFVIVPK